MRRSGFPVETSDDFDSRRMVVCGLYRLDGIKELMSSPSVYFYSLLVYFLVSCLQLSRVSLILATEHGISVVAPLSQLPTKFPPFYVSSLGSSLLSIVNLRLRFCRCSSQSYPSIIGFPTSPWLLRFWRAILGFFTFFLSSFFCPFLSTLLGRQRVMP